MSRAMAMPPAIQSNMRVRMSPCYIYCQIFGSLFASTDIQNWLYEIDYNNLALPSKHALLTSDYGDLIDAAASDPTGNEIQAALGTCRYPICDEE